MTEFETPTPSIYTVSAGKEETEVIIRHIAHKTATEVIKKFINLNYFRDEYQTLLCNEVVNTTVEAVDSLTTQCAGKGVLEHFLKSGNDVTRAKKLLIMRSTAYTAATTGIRLVLGMKGTNN